jgi:hypothetical protein
MDADPPFVMTVRGADGGTHRYYVRAKNLRHAKRDAREWVVQTEWCESLVDVSPVYDSSQRRLLAVAATTFVVSGIAITAAMVIALSIQGAL